MVERNTGLHARARRARAEAVERLGTDAQRFRTAIDRYAAAVEVADYARREWERLERPLWTEGSLGQLVEHPLIRTIDRSERAAARFGDSLGLTPAAERRLGRVGLYGRPAGANSAPDRRMPPRLLRARAGL
jgi:hypothetical protein